MDLKYTVNVQSEFPIPKGFKVDAVMVTEKKEVGIEYISDPQDHDFLHNHHDSVLRATKPLKDGAEVVITVSES